MARAGEIWQKGCRKLAEKLQTKGKDQLALWGALAVFLGGASYGFMAPLIKIVGSKGFAWTQIMPAQSYGGLVLFAVAFGVSLLRGGRWKHVDARDWVRMLALGASTGLTNLSYNFCLTNVSASMGVTLLFQYVWMGIAIQAFMAKKPPVAMEALAAIIVLVGTVGASGVLDGTLTLNLPGLLTGLGAALGYSVFLLISPRAGVDVPMMQRGLITCMGSCLVAIFVCPTWLFGAVDLGVLGPYALVMGFFALFLPVPLIGFGSRHISGGACNILASSELPSSFLIAYLLLGEPMGITRIAGMVIILLGIALTQVKLK